MVLWDSEHYPDYRMFLEAALKTGVKLMLFAHPRIRSRATSTTCWSSSKICDLDRDEQRDYETRLRELRVYEGVTCSLELAFDHDSQPVRLRTSARLVRGVPQSWKTKSLAPWPTRAI